MKRAKFFLIVAVVLVTGFAGRVYGFPWSKDMKSQPSIKSHERPMVPPENTLHRGQSRLPMTREELGQKVKNPVNPTERSLDNGKRLFMIHCALCHGAKGKGDGAVAKKFVPPPDLSLDFYKNRPDGFIYGTIKYGGAVMPAYGENIPEREIWDIVNYVRILQGK